MFYIAWKNLINERIRLVISILGISFAILLIFAIKGIGVGMVDSVVKYANNQSAEIFVFQKGVQNMQMASSLLPSAVLESIRAIDGIDEAEGLYGFNYQHKIDDSKISAYIIGFDKLGGPWSMKEGSKSPKEDEVVLDFAFAKKGGYKVGDSIDIIGSNFKVAGISSETNPLGGLFIFLNKNAVEKILNSKGTLNIILVKAKNGVEIDKLIEDINKKIPVVNAVKSSTVAQNEAEMINELFNPIINAMILVVVLVSTAFIGLTIYNATLEKIEEYTILKAIGTNRNQLFVIVFFQSFTIAFSGIIVGFLLTYLMAYLFSELKPEITVAVSLSIAIKYLWIVPVMSILATYIPLKKIYRIDEADVLRS